MGFFVKVGDRIARTINCFSTAGYVNLLNEDEGVLNAEYSTIHNIVGQGLLKCEGQEK